jgi:hypothetical protein
MKNNSFPNDLIFRNGGMRNGTRVFILVEPFIVNTSLGEVIIPKDFHTDGASIPKMFHGIMGPYGSYFEAAVFHDWGYSENNKIFTKKEVDLIFKELMYNLGVKWHVRETIYRSVRTFGWIFYKGYNGD